MDEGVLGKRTGGGCSPECAAGRCGQAGPAGARTAKGQRCGTYRLGEGQGEAGEEGQEEGVTASGGQELCIGQARRPRRRRTFTFVNALRALGTWEG